MLSDFLISLLLVSAAPTLLLLLIRLYISIGETWAHAVVVTSLAALNIIVFGPPDFSRASYLSVPIGIGVGILYYEVEKLRLAYANRSALRLNAPIEQPPTMLVVMLLTMSLIAVAEELLFRWYVVFVPIHSGLLPRGVVVVLSSCAFGLVHQSFGLNTVLSRAAFGLLLALVVICWGDLLLTITAHAIYNCLVYLRPTRHVRMRRKVSQ